MIEIIKQRIDQIQTKEAQYAELRQLLQIVILRILEIKGAFSHLAFVGGTASRLVYGLNRFSEDLDFSLVNPQSYHFRDLLDQIKSQLQFYGFEVIITMKENGAVNNSFIKFQNILQKFGLTSHQEQVLSIKLEIDKNPPPGFHSLFTPINHLFFINIHHFDLPSLFAGKLHAILCRSFEKGRDFYDLFWFISKKVVPNYRLLENAYAQTQNIQLKFDSHQLSDLLAEKISVLNFSQLKKDLQPFVIDPSDLRIIDKDTLLNAAQAIRRL